MIKFFVKGKVLLTTKDFLFILASLVMLLFILDAFANETRIGSYFLYVLFFLDFIYALKIVENYKIQETKKTEPNLDSNPKIQIPVKKFFEA